LIISGLVQYFIKEFTDIHLLLYAFTGMSTSIVAGYLVSLFFGKNDDENKQYTFYSLKNK
nr:hypothetical protein [Saprospiraceae bacterium]